MVIERCARLERCFPLLPGLPVLHERQRVGGTGADESVEQEHLSIQRVVLAVIVLERIQHEQRFGLTDAPRARNAPSARSLPPAPIFSTTR